MELSRPMSVQDRSTPSRITSLEWSAMTLGVLALGLLIHHSLTAPHAVNAGADHGGHGHAPHWISVIPFVGILLSIAMLPLIPATHHWWERNKNRLMVSLVFAGVTLVYYAMSQGAAKVVGVLEHAIIAEYIPFIVLLFSLYAISGGISLRGDLAAHPITNTTFLGVGALLASFIGTTGASMLLIRPLLQTNSERKHVRHTVIFFIFLVSNVGGCLLPIGDPPLFLGYLKGVPFFWTLALWKEWAAMSAVLLVIYFLWDTRAYRHEEVRDIVRDETARTRLSLRGTVNIALLIGVVFAVAKIQPGQPLPLLGGTAFPFLRELVMMGLVALSLALTPSGVREANKFNYAAILEVGALFIGIFICMQAPVEILRTSGEALAPYLSSPAHYFWLTGALSSVLDNAPTYVVFFETAESMTPAGAAGALSLLDGGAIDTARLVAISLGAVFMGANTYIGNGPNFMVKSIAEQSGVRMPSFFGYMVYSLGILVPLFVMVTILFL